MSKSNTYKCAECGETFNEGWTDAEARDEKEDNYGSMSYEDMAIVCDDCFNEVRTNTLLVLDSHPGHGAGEDKRDRVPCGVTAEIDKNPIKASVEAVLQRYLDANLMRPIEEPTDCRDKEDEPSP